MKQKTVYWLPVTEFEELVQRHYAPEYDFVRTTLCGNDRTFYFPKVDGQRHPNEWEEANNVDFKGEQANAGTLLDQLCKEGYIPAGEYILHVSW